MNDIFIILAGVLIGIGITLLAVAHIFALVTTMGMSRNWGIASLFVPLLPLAFCLAHRKEAGYPLRLFGAGLALLAVALSTLFFAGIIHPDSLRTADLNPFR